MADAENLLRPAASELPAAAEGLQVIGWIRRDYSLSQADALTKLRGSIKDVSPQDVSRWIERGELQHRVIDGEVRIFRSEPSNLFRFSDDAVKRRLAPIAEPKWKLETHIARVLAAADKAQRADVVPIRHRLKYTLTVNADAPGIKAGAKVRVWLPYPRQTKQQSRIYMVSTEPPDGKVSPAAEPHQTVYFEKQVEKTGEPLRFQVIAEFATSAWCPRLEDALAKEPAELTAALRECLAERPPHIVFTPELKKVVADAIGQETNPLTKARGIFRWVSQNIAYANEDEYGTVPSLTRKVLSCRKGDCGVQGMLFISMCRLAGIPARWQSGWQTRRDGTNMHDWAEFYVEPWGWLPADPSYGLRESADPRVREFYLGHLDSYRMIVNADYGKALWPAKHSLRSEPVDFQRGELEVDGKNLYFPHWDYDFDIAWLDEGP